MSAILRWSFFGCLVLFYCLYYAPYGVNETDGGFLTGLAWQVLNGKVLYQDVIYVRPPLPVWLRCLELRVLPSEWAILGERYFFYLKVAAYSFMGAAVLAEGRMKWWLALFGFVVSVHCYPPAAWHTTDGILFGVLAVYLAKPCLEKSSLPTKLALAPSWVHVVSALFSGIAIAFALGCKQSFYPLILLLLVAPYPTLRARLWSCMGFLLTGCLFFIYLFKNNLLLGYLEITSGSTSGGQALQHGIIDYFRIQPALAIGSAAILFATFFLHRKGIYPFLCICFWSGWLLLLTSAYVYAIHQRQEFTIPFAQSRLLFWVAVGYLLFLGQQRRIYWWKNRVESPAFFSLLSLLLVSWSAAVSWGYNLPILFAIPWVFVALVVSQTLWVKALPESKGPIMAGIVLLGLLCVFRYAYEFVYRDGRRSEMNMDMGSVFPSFRGIRSDKTSLALYQELKTLSSKYGPYVKTLPSFPQAAYLTGTVPVLPLDWVVEREMGNQRNLVLLALSSQKPILLVEKPFRAHLDQFIEGKGKPDPELRLTRQVLQQGELLEETNYFWVIRFVDNDE